MMTTNNNFVKIEDMIINVNSVDVIYEDHSRGHVHDYVVQINGEKYYVDDIRPILNAIGMNSTSSFDPDKRIDTTTRGYDFRIASTKIKAAVDEFNNNRIYGRIEMKVNPEKKEIKITSEIGNNSMIIQDGITTLDSLKNSVYTELKKKISNILIEG